MSGICAVGIEFERHVIHIVAALKRRAVDGDAHGVRAEGGQVGVDEAADGDVFAAGAEGLDVAGVGVAEVDRQRSAVLREVEQLHVVWHNAGGFERREHTVLVKRRGGNVLRQKVLGGLVAGVDGYGHAGRGGRFGFALRGGNGLALRGLLQCPAGRDAEDEEHGCENYKYLFECIFHNETSIRYGVILAEKSTDVIIIFLNMSEGEGYETGRHSGRPLRC